MKISIITKIVIFSDFPAIKTRWQRQKYLGSLIAELNGKFSYPASFVENNINCQLKAASSPKKYLRSLQNWKIVKTPFWTNTPPHILEKISNWGTPPTSPFADIILEQNLRWKYNIIYGEQIWFWNTILDYIAVSRHNLNITYEW